MILLSRSLGRNGTLGVLVAALLSAVPACDKTCGLVGLPPEGLSITFEGNFSSAATFDIVVSVVTATPETVPIARCTLVASDGGSVQLSCSSQEAHSESSNTLRIEDNSLPKVLVTVSTGGNTVAEQTFEPVYRTREVNGPGCGTSTSAAIQLTIP
jgi:hypothetical protein